MTYEEMKQEMHEAVYGVLERYMKDNRFFKLGNNKIGKDVQDIALSAAIKAVYTEKHNPTQLLAAKILGFNRNTILKMQRKFDIDTPRTYRN